MDNRNHRVLKLLDSPKFIYVADHPPTLGGTIKKMSPDEFAKQIGMEYWTDSLIIDADFPTTKKKMTPYTQHKFDEIFNQIKINRDKLVIANMGETGYGLFAKEDIEANTPFAVYSGYLRPVSEKHPLKSHDSFYGVALHDDNKEMIASIDAKSCGNVSRFSQHLPRTHSQGMDTISIENYTFSNEIDVNNVAVENIDVKKFKYCGYDLPIYYTKNKIKAGEILGWDYSIIYWKNHRCIPLLYDKNGHTLDQTHYANNNVQFFIYVDSRNDYARLPWNRPSLMEIIKNGLLSIKCEDTMITLSEETINKALQPYTHSPYVIIEHPDKIENYIPQTAVPSTLYSNVSHSTTIRKALDKITQSDLAGSRWRYDAKKDIAYIEHSDQDKINQVAKMLTEKGLSVRAGINKATKIPLLFVDHPDLKKLDSQAVKLDQKLDALQLNHAS